MTWRQRARRQAGVISRTQLAADGLSASRVDRLMRCGSLEPVHRGVLLVGGAPLSYRARLWAAVLATGGVLSGPTAAGLWGVIDADSATITVLMPHRRRIARPHGVVLRRWRDHQPPGHVLRDGLPTTPRAWTVMSMLAELQPGAATTLADRALQRRWITPAQLTTRLHQHPYRRGNAQLRRLLTTTADGAAAESERRLHRLLRAGDIRGWTPNCPVWIDGELIAVVDVALRRHKIAIEVDGMAHHVDVDRFRRDRSRQNQLVTQGWTVLRFTWADLTERPGYVVRTIRAAIAGPGDG